MQYSKKFGQKKMAIVPQFIIALIDVKNRMKRF